MDNPIRVLQLTGTLGYAGIEAVVMNLYRSIDREKLQFDFVVTEASGRFDSEVESLGGRIFRLPSRSRHPFKYMKQLKMLLKAHKEYKIVHCHVNSASGYMDLSAAKSAKVKHRILHSHNARCIVVWQHNIFKHFLKGVVTDKIACSVEAAKWMFKSDKNVKIMNNGILLDRYTYNERTRQAVRERTSSTDKFVIGHVGSFQERKNQKFLIEVFAQLQQENKELWLIGEGETKEPLTRLAEDLGVLNKIKFFGNRGDINELMQAMDVFAFPSIFEGLSVCLIEAQSAGLPCLVSDTTTELAKITDHFIMLDIADKDAWTKAIEQATHFKRKKSDSMIIKAGFDMQEQANWLEKHYFDMLNK